FPAITTVVSIAGKVLGPNHLVLAQRGVYFGSEDVQPLAQQVLRNGQCWQQTNHIAVDTTGQNEQALLLTGRSDLCSDLTIDKFNGHHRAASAHIDHCLRFGQWLQVLTNDCLYLPRTAGKVVAFELFNCCERRCTRDRIAAISAAKRTWDGAVHNLSPASYS